MAETELTKEIKRSIRSYRPLMKSNMRTVRWAEEVDVGAGYVDSIRFEDYIKNIDDVYICDKSKEKVDIDNPLCDRKTCCGCVYKSSNLHERVLDIACTCFEIKITKNDFKSNNGHNFVGNYNYYVIPKELYKDISELVPEDIGIILYHGHGCLKIKKKCKFKEVGTENLNRYMFNALKKWCDLNYFTYEKYIG